MLWDPYVFRRGDGVFELWDQLHAHRRLRILYIGGAGFDVRAQSTLGAYLESLRHRDVTIDHAQLMLIECQGYELDPVLAELSKTNAARQAEMFRQVGDTAHVVLSASGSDRDAGPSASLREIVHSVSLAMAGCTDVVLDVSSLPRVAYLAVLMTALAALVPTDPASATEAPLAAKGVNFSVLVAEDAALDGRIRAQDPTSELVQLPGFAGAFHAESVKDWPLVWFPILGENRVGQLEKILAAADISPNAEICPVVPHPSKNPRRGDDLLVEYIDPLFRSRKTPTSNIIYAHESNPFEAYRQLLGAMRRYQRSMAVLGNCRLVLTPLGSKLLTIGAGLACFEMRPVDPSANYRVAVPLAEPRRYVASAEDLRASQPDLCALLLTGVAYS